MPNEGDCCYKRLSEYYNLDDKGSSLKQRGYYVNGARYSSSTSITIAVHLQIVLKVKNTSAPPHFYSFLTSTDNINDTTY